MMFMLLCDKTSR